MVSLLVVFNILFVSGGSLLTSVIGAQQIQDTVSYSTDDVRVLAEAKVNADIYGFNTRKELNYTFNNVAYEIGDDAGELNWNDNIPTMEEAEEEFKQQLLTREDINIKTQNRAGDCDPPNIDESVLSIPDRHVLELDFSDPWIECSGLNTTAMIPVSETFSVENPKNNYLYLAENAINLAEESKSIISDSDWSQTGSETSPLNYVEVPDDSDRNACYHMASGHGNEAEDAARESAESEFDDSDIGSEAFNSLDNVNSFVELSQTNTDIDEEVVAASGYPKTETCTFEVCSGEYNEDGECIMEEEQTDYNLYKYQAVADEVEVDFELTDQANTVITYDSAETNLVFDFTYVNTEDVG